MLKVGITGGIGTGKSEVCKILEQLGSPVFYADNVAKDLLNTNPKIISQVKQIFGNHIYERQGKLDKKLLAKKIFFDESLKSKLENIVHPVVIEYILDQFKKIQEKSNNLLAFVEAALIFETNFNQKLDYTIVVDADMEKCINRVMKRDNVQREDVISRIKNQMDPHKKVKLADFVIHNNSTIDDLKKNVIFIHNLLTKIANTRYELKRS